MKKNILLKAVMLTLTFAGVSQIWSASGTPASTPDVSAEISVLQSSVQALALAVNGPVCPVKPAQAIGWAGAGSAGSLQGQIYTTGQNMACGFQGLQYRIIGQQNKQGITMMREHLKPPRAAENYFCRMTGLRDYSTAISSATTSPRLNSFKALCDGLGLSMTDTTASSFGTFIRTVSIPKRYGLERQDAMGGTSSLPN